MNRKRIVMLMCAFMMEGSAILPAGAVNLEDKAASVSGGQLPAASESGGQLPAAPESEGQLSAASESADSIFTSTEPAVEIIEWDPQWPYASYSQIHTGSAVLYRVPNGNGRVICVNAGHGTAGGESVMTMCHPDGTPKVTGGSTAEGATYAVSVSSGTTMADGTPEGRVNLQMAMLLKERLLQEGFSVLMIRESEDVQFDNIARTVIANQYADCHIALHYDSTASDKGFFFMSVPDVASYKNMEPVCHIWPEHNRLGQSLTAGVSSCGIHLYGDGSMPMDLTQTSYSTIPSVDVECGDTASDWSAENQKRTAEGITQGLRLYFGMGSCS